jgi:hypothetical protein
MAYCRTFSYNAKLTSVFNIYFIKYVNHLI